MKHNETLFVYLHFSRLFPNLCHYLPQHLSCMKWKHATSLIDVYWWRIPSLWFIVSYIFSLNILQCSILCLRTVQSKYICINRHSLDSLALLLALLAHFYIISTRVNDAIAPFRAYRIGQCRDVTVLRLISLGTVEEIIYLRQVYKQVDAPILNTPLFFPLHRLEFTIIFVFLPY